MAYDGIVTRAVVNEMKEKIYLGKIEKVYQPEADELVFNISRSYDCTVLTKELKVQMLGIPTLDVHIGNCRSPLMVAVSQTTASLYKCFKGELRQIVYPKV